jgi:hypothetical protein
MRVVKLPVGMLLWFATLGAVTGCADSDEPALGSLRLNLVGQAPSGTVYRLRDARITVQGPANHEWNSEDDPDQTSMSADVPTGSYAARLQDGWRLERLDQTPGQAPSGSSPTPVTAQLISDNPALFAVTALQRTSVPLRFRVDGGDVDLTQGYDLVVTVEEPRAPLVAVTSLGVSLFFPSITVYPASAQGDVPPLRRIVGGSTGLAVPFSLGVVGDQFVVPTSAAFGAGLSFYPTTGNGDISPARQIGSPTLFNTRDMAVFQDEIYFLTDSSIAVFPATAIGFVVPTRTLSFTIDGGGGDRGIALAVDNGELYLAAGDPTRIDVYPASAAGTVTPTRSIAVMSPSSSCIAGVAVHGGEIFVSDDCARQVRVYSATASGSVAPLRVIAGADTGLQSPTKMAWFESELYVCDGLDSVRVFPAGADGNVAPTRVIEGPRTNLSLPWGVVVF